MNVLRCSRCCGFGVLGGVFWVWVLGVGVFGVLVSVVWLVGCGLWVMHVAGLGFGFGGFAFMVGVLVLNILVGLL